MENLQHVQLPNRNLNDSITPKDQLIYVTIKRYMNSKTKQAFPSQQLISEKSGASINTIKKCISNLENAGYIKVLDNGRGRGKTYEFNDYKTFEPFSYEFLDNDNLTFLEKTYIVASQQHMYKSDGVGSISYTNKELSNLINMPESTISKCNRQLETKGYLTTVNNNNVETESKCHTKTKLFHLNEIGQQIVFVLKQHEDRLNDHDYRLDKLEKENEDLKKKNELMLRELTKLTKKETKFIID